MDRARRDVAQVQGMQQFADRPLVVSNLVFRFDPTLDIHTAPANKPVLLRIRTFQDVRLHRSFLLRRQPLLRVTARSIAQTVWPLLVETVNPVAQSLTVHPAVRGSILPARPLQNRRYRHQTQSNPAIVLSTRQLAQIIRLVILPNGYRSMHVRLHPMTPRPNHNLAKIGIPKLSHFIGRLV